MSTLTGFLGGIVARFTAWRERERAFAELNALDDRILADLGLRRGDIPYVVYCKAQQSTATAAPATPAASPANSNGGLRAA
ncbi:MAG TPA: DUF1127 domain-containing protein [Stellaceae bacterium]|jgi:uncharacterized protein YjiS (DUF1127 family)|nr:DUF1127 domain-containing protein [Stellaceae bacterium]